MSLTVVLSLVGTLAAASIAAAVALYVSRLARLNAAELRHSEIREKAYEVFLASCDRAWHLRIKTCVDSYRHREPIPEDKVEQLGEAINRQGTCAVEDLQRHSRNFEKASPVLLRLYYEAFERAYPKPAEFEAARVAVQELQRGETGLRKQLGLVHKASLRQELKKRREVRRLMSGVTTLRLVDDAGADEAIIHQGDGEAIWFLLQENMREWDELEQCIVRQDSRSVRWKSLGLWPE